MDTYFDKIINSNTYDEFITNFIVYSNPFMSMFKSLPNNTEFVDLFTRLSLTKSLEDILKNEQIKNLIDITLTKILS